eukprot:scaffold420_cov342-Pavlova_lutheri.AAC.5
MPGKGTKQALKERSKAVARTREKKRTQSTRWASYNVLLFVAPNIPKSLAFMTRKSEPAPVRRHERESSTQDSHLRKEHRKSCRMKPSKCGMGHEAEHDPLGPTRPKRSPWVLRVFFRALPVRGKILVDVLAWQCKLKDRQRVLCGLISASSPESVHRLPSGV